MVSIRLQGSINYNTLDVLFTFLFLLNKVINNFLQQYRNIERNKNLNIDTATHTLQYNGTVTIKYLSYIYET